MTKKRFLHLSLNAISLTVIGLGIGWLMGLSVTQGTTLSILANIMTVVVLLITAVSGLERETFTSEEKPKSYAKWKVSPVPMALFIIGIVFGSSLGIYARTHNWLGNDESNYSINNTSDNVRASIGGLFADGHDECERLQNYEENELPKKLKTSTIEIFQVLEPNLPLHEIVKKQCSVLQNRKK